MRKRDERFNWLNMTPAQQLHIIKLCRQRYLRKIKRDQANVAEQKIDDSPQQDLF
jgi:predicted Fe-S protein YdhL (DUF1289 family)